MADNLKIFGVTYPNAKGIKVKNTNDDLLTFTRPVLQTKSATPSETAQTITPDTGYDGLEQVNVAAISSSYIGSGVTRRSSTDLTASGDTVTVPSGYYENNASKAVSAGTAGTPTATKGSVSNHSISVTPSVTNTAGYISAGTKTGTAVTVTAAELVSGSETKTENGTYDVTNLASLIVDVQGGGGSSMQIGNLEGYATSSSISFTGLQGEPTAFSIMVDTAVNPGTPSKIVAVVFDGTSLHAQTITNTANAQVTYDSTSLSKTYSNGTLTITSNGPSFVVDVYYGVYVYDGGAVETKDVQVGSGATSITFTGLEAEPAWWSCIFKSNFGTSSGYQRVIYVAKGTTTTNVSGLEMDSEAHNQSTHWTASYNNGSFTITSQGTNAGGYFHQPGYYQLTYAYDDGSGGNYQSKTVTPTTSQQVVEADSGYDALKMVTVNAIPSEYIVPSGNINITSNTATGQTLNVAQYATATVAVPTGGGANIATATMTNNDNQSTSIAFTLPSGRTPKAFFARLTSQIARNSSSRYYYVFDMRWDGSSTGGVAGNTFYMYSGTLTNVTSGYSYSQSGTTFTLSSTGSRSASPGSFYNGTYELVYIY